MLAGKRKRVGSITTIVVLIVMTFILITAGCFNERTPQTDIIIIKTDSNGTIEWSTNLNNGMQDMGNTIIETSDEGYLFAGGISYNPQGDISRQVFPRLVKLDKSGSVDWDMVLNSTTGLYNSSDSVGISTVIEKPDGHFLAGLNNGWVLTIAPNGTLISSTVLENRDLLVIGTREGGSLFVGEKTMKFDAAGNLQWEKPLKRLSSAIQMTDGRFVLDNYSNNNDGISASVTCLHTNGTTLWTRELNRWPENKVSSFHESSQGVVDITYTYRLWDVEKDLRNPEMATEMSLNPDGDIIARRNISAAGPLSRTRDNGYVFVAIPFFDSGNFTTDYSKDSILHMVKLSSAGETVWDKPLTAPGYYYPLSVITARDGGYVALVGADVSN